MSFTKVYFLTVTTTVTKSLNNKITGTPSSETGEFEFLVEKGLFSSLL